MTTMKMSSVSSTKNLGTMGKTYRHEREWGRPSKKRNTKKKGRDRVQFSSPMGEKHDTQQDEYSEYDDFEMKTLDEEWNDRHKRD